MFVLFIFTPIIVFRVVLNLALSQVMRIGSISQTGSDSLLTSATFFKMRELYFSDKIDDEQFNGTLYGLGSSYANGNLFTDPDRAGTTAAERDRTPLTHTPRLQQQQQQQGQIPSQALGGPPGLTNGMSSGMPMGGTFSAGLGTPFGNLPGNPFARSAMGTVGGDR